MAHSKGSLFLRTYKKTVVKTTNTWISSKLCLAYARFDSQFSNLVLACCRIRGKKKPVKSVFSLFITPTPKHCLTGNGSYKILVGGLCSTLIKYMTILYHYFCLPHLLLHQCLCTAELSWLYLRSTGGDDFAATEGFCIFVENLFHWKRLVREPIQIPTPLPPLPPPSA